MHSHDTQRLIALARRVLGDAARADACLDRPSIELGGRSPRQLLGSTEAVRVEELLAQIDDERRLGH